MAIKKLGLVISDGASLRNIIIQMQSLYEKTDKTNYRSNKLNIRLFTDKYETFQ